MPIFYINKKEAWASRKGKRDQWWCVEIEKAEPVKKPLGNNLGPMNMEEKLGSYFFQKRPYIFLA